MIFLFGDNNFCVIFALVIIIQKTMKLTEKQKRIIYPLIMLGAIIFALAAESALDEDWEQQYNIEQINK